MSSLRSIIFVEKKAEILLATGGYSLHSDRAYLLIQRGFDLS